MTLVPSMNSTSYPDWIFCHLLSERLSFEGLLWNPPVPYYCDVGGFKGALNWVLLMPEGRSLSGAVRGNRWRKFRWASHKIPTRINKKTDRTIMMVQLSGRLAIDGHPLKPLKHHSTMTSRDLRGEPSIKAPYYAERRKILLRPRRLGNATSPRLYGGYILQLWGGRNVFYDRTKTKYFPPLEQQQLFIALSQQTGKQLTFSVWETGVSRHNEHPIKGSP